MSNIDKMRTKSPHTKMMVDNIEIFEFQASTTFLASQNQFVYASSVYFYNISTAV